MPPTYLALLRGINVGGHGKLPTAELTRLCTAAGFENVRTYIQSGNVIFTATPAIAATLLRTQAELADLIAQTPYPPEQAYVNFLLQPPTKLPRAVAPEAFTVYGLHLYLHLPNGVGNSKLAASLTRQGTARNWRTVTKLHEMMLPAETAFPSPADRPFETVDPPPALPTLASVPARPSRTLIGG